MVSGGRRPFINTPLAIKQDLAVSRPGIKATQAFDNSDMD